MQRRQKGQKRNPIKPRNEAFMEMMEMTKPSRIPAKKGKGSYNKKKERQKDWS